MIDQKGVEIDIQFMEVSALDGNGVDSLFNSIAEKIVDKYNVRNNISFKKTTPEP